MVQVFHKGAQAVTRQRMPVDQVKTQHAFNKPGTMLGDILMLHAANAVLIPSKRQKMRLYIHWDKADLIYQN